jgi:peptide deformylase
MNNIRLFPDPILTTPCQAFNFFEPQEDPQTIVKVLTEKMIENNGVGIAANQIGYPYRVFIIRGTEYNYVFFNPKIVSMSKDQTNLEESCLSVPGVTVKVKRASEIRLRFQVPSGETTTKTFNGLSAKIIQHEIDHLDGILFFNRANRYHRDKAMKGYYNGR